MSTISNVSTQTAVIERQLVALALDPVQEYRARAGAKERVYESRCVFATVAKVTTDDLSIVFVPLVVADGAVGVVEADLNCSLQRLGSVHQSQIPVTAGCS